MASKSEQKLSLFALTAMVVGSMVGAGIFNLPGRFTTATGPFRAIIAAWCIAGGVYMAHAFRSLAKKPPEIEPGVLPQLFSCLGNPTTGGSTDAC